MGSCVIEPKRENLQFPRNKEKIHREQIEASGCKRGESPRQNKMILSNTSEINIQIEDEAPQSQPQQPDYMKKVKNKRQVKYPTSWQIQKSEAWKSGKNERRKESEEDEKQRVEKYMKRYPVNSDDLRETQVITLQKNDVETSSGTSLHKEEQKQEHKIQHLKVSKPPLAPLSVISEEASKSSPFESKIEEEGQRSQHNVN